MIDDYRLEKRIFGLEIDPDTGKDNLMNIVNDTLQIIDTDGFADDPEEALLEQGLYLLYMHCRGYMPGTPLDDQDERIPVWKGYKNNN